MTNQSGASGPSLVQARKTTCHDRRQQHLRHHHQRQRQHHHHHRLHPQPQARQPRAPDSTAPHIRSSPNEKLHEPQVVVVQTVSVVHYVDASGAVTGVSTLRSDTVAPSSSDSLAGDTAGFSALGTTLPSVSLPGLIPTLGDGAPSTTASAQPEPSWSSSWSASPETLTSSPFSGSSAFPILSTSIFNSSSPSSSHVPSFFGNSTRAHFANSTRTSFAVKTTSSFSNISTSTRLLSATTAHVTSIVSGGGADAGAGTPESASPTEESNPDSGSGLPPQTRNAVVGGVVGSVAGIALILLALLYFLKWRKQHGRGIMLLGDGDSTARRRRLFSRSPLNPGGGGRGGMAERSGPSGIPAAFAKVIGGRRAANAPAAEPATQEKGFYRVSGRKLVSVLESGGDGYSEPHESIGSGASFYRDSNPFSDIPGRPPLQLGSPMRPVSGVPIMREGPQRTPVQEHGPLPPGYRPSAYPTNLSPPDQLSRFVSRDGSRGSGSRFTEDT